MTTGYWRRSPYTQRSPYDLRSRTISELRQQNPRYVNYWPLDLKDYIIQAELGEGSFATVHKCIVRKTNKVAAMKVIRVRAFLRFFCRRRKTRLFIAL